MKTIYVDNNATTQVAPEVLESMIPFLRDMWGNPSSMHTFGGQVAKYIDEARNNIASLIGAESPNEIIITSCGTESDNTAIRSALAAKPDKRHIVTSSVEHPAVLNLAKQLETEGYSVTYLQVDELGRIDLSELEKSLTPDTALASIMWANNETGVIFPIEKIAEMCSERKIPLHVDAVQAVGKIPINLTKTPITYLSLSGHKLHAPKGVGVLYVRKGTPFTPWLVGGHQERGRRGGTENVASIIGLGIACRLLSSNLTNEAKYLSSLRDRLEKGILDAIPNSFIHGDTSNRLPNTTNIGFESIEGEAILLMLNEFNICASSGSACTSGSLDPSHVMMAMGIPFTRAHGSIRFSLSRYNTEEDINIILEKLPGIIKHLRELSPFT
ncbi:MAG: cysteine desulfurase NifS [Deltaproteobacteria bacterium]|nr:cysteine desulfurase NifS [Deltaproteobacteria bacterium]